MGRSESWLPDFVRAVYHANFGIDRDISDPEVIADIVASLGLRPEDILARAQSDEVKTMLKQQGERARDLGIFGAPSFCIGEELFWGNDRLGNALSWARIGED